MNRRILLAICTLVTACTLLGSCSSETTATDKVTDTSELESIATDEAVTTENETPVTDNGYWEYGEELTEFETPYIDIEYPEDWSEIFEIISVENEDGYLISFNGTGDLDGICMFDFMFGEDDRQDAYFLGTYVKDDQSVPVYVLVYEPSAELSEEQTLRFNDLQGYVNDIMAQIQHTEGFVRR